MRRGGLTVAIAAAFAACLAASSGAARPRLVAPSGPRDAAAAQNVDTPHRVVSLIPAVTEMIFAIGDGARLAGVSSYDRYPPDVQAIERVGGLLDPNIEKILSLRPDLVILYATQLELKARLARAGIPFYSYEHRGLADITQTLRAVGARIGSADAANRLASTMESELAAISRAAAGRPRPKTMLVFGREPGSLRGIVASGGIGFLHDMLVVAGGDDVFGDLKRQSVDVTTEMVLARRPEVIIELRYGDRLPAADAQRIAREWDALPAVPAVRDHRVHVLVGDQFVVPGPRVVDATRAFAAVLRAR
ncbi:MAG TPA: helical backbone metal receptor [Vicinamibacterales bacterium]|nr:helical backbone metal receptor [Vicinamibacterales bacterium]